MMFAKFLALRIKKIIEFNVIMINKQKASIWRENRLGYLSAHIICTERGEVFREIFSGQLGAIVCIILQIFFAMRAVLKIGEYLTLLYSWRFSRYSTPIHWLVHGHMTSNNETVSRQMP